MSVGRWQSVKALAHTSITAITDHGESRGKRASRLSVPCVLEMRMVWLLLITAVVFACNVYVWLVRIMRRADFRYQYRLTTFSRLYIPAELRAVDRFTLMNRRRLEVRLSPRPAAATAWVVTPDEGQPYETTGRFPVIELLDRFHNYKITQKAGGDDGWRFELGLDFASAAFYESRGASIGDQYELKWCTLPVGRDHRVPISRFARPQPEGREAETVRTMLREQADVREADTTIERIEKVGCFLLNHLDDKRGVPPADLMSRSPLEQFQRARDGEVKVWCANMAAIFVMFGNGAGVPTRLVSVGGRLNEIKLTGHTFCECFIAEQQRWAYVDLMSRKLLVRNHEGDCLGAVGLSQLVRMNMWRHANVRLYHEGAVKTASYGAVLASEIHALRSDVTFVFHRHRGAAPVLPRKLVQALRVVLCPDLAYAINRTGRRYSITVGLFYLQCLLLVMCVLGLIQWLAHR